MVSGPPSDVWIDHRIEVRDSPIDGCGLFFTSDVDEATVVMRLGGVLVDSTELDRLIEQAGADAEAPYVDSITVSDDAHLVLPPNTIIHFGNHSCDPTLWHVGPYDLATRRRVLAGEEVTIDYGTQSGAAGFRMTCRCRAASCRGLVTSEDWQRPELQARYGDHWVPALQSRIRSGQN